VGRTLLLANVGVHLARRARVVLWDLDLEAPGLHRIPDLRPAAAPRGFLEWLHTHASRAELDDHARQELRNYVQRVPGRPNLSILPAHGDDADFALLYQQIPWETLLVTEPARGLALFRAALGVLSEGHDHVLIDARTGVTDIGGLCAAILPNLTVLVGGYGHQNLHGLLHVRKALEPAVAGKFPPALRPDPGAHLELVHVVSPVPEDTPEAADRRRVWREVFPNVTPIEIPFDRRLLFAEQLLVLDEARPPAARAYQEVAERVDVAARRLRSLTEAQPHDGEAPPAAFDFERRVERLLTLHGYRVERGTQSTSGDADLVARLSAGLDEQTWWVVCKDQSRPCGTDAFDRLLARLSPGHSADEARDARGMVVARAFTNAALARAQSNARLRAVTVEELERRLFDPRPYLTDLVTAFESSALARTWVSQRVALEAAPKEKPGADLLEHGLAWADGEGRRLWLLLGDFGTGKTCYFQRFGYELARRALRDPEAPFPIAIDLKEFPNAISLEMLLLEHLRARIPGFRGTPEAILHLVASGRAVLLLDAFDEMGVAAAGRSVDEQFRQLAHVAGQSPLDRRGNRVLITCRTHFFRDQQQVRDAATAEPVTSVDSALGQLARRFDASIDEVMLFDDAQIDDFLRRTLGNARAVEARDFIRRTYDLGSLAPRPVLLDMITRSLPALMETGGEVTPAGLYAVYTRQWLDERHGPHFQTLPEQRHRLLAVLAGVLWEREERRIHHADLLAEVRKLAEMFPGIDHERVDVELRTAAFLVRSANGYYRFAHKSFLEFFFARRLADSLGEGRLEAFDTAVVTPEVRAFFWDLDPARREGMARRIGEVLRTAYRPRLSENLVRLAVGRLGMEFEGAQLAGARLEGERLGGIHLPKADLQRATLDGAWLDGAVLKGADMRGASLEAASLVGADLSRADLRGARLPVARLTTAMMRTTRLDGADLTGADLRGARLHGASLVGAKLRFARLADAQARNATWEGADLGGATAPRMVEPPAGVPTLPKQPRGRAVPARPMVARFRLAGDAAVSVGEDGWVRTWDLGAGREVAGFALREPPVCAAIGRDARFVAAGFADGGVEVWPAQGGEARRMQTRRPLHCMDVSADGQWVVGADARRTMWTLDLAKSTSETRGVGARVSTIRITPDGRRVAAGAQNGTFVWQGDRELFRDVTTGVPGFVDLTPDGRWVLVRTVHGSLDVWEVDGKQTRVHTRALPFDTWADARFTADGAIYDTRGSGQEHARRARLYDVLSPHVSLRPSTEGTSLVALHQPYAARRLPERKTPQSRGWGLGPLALSTNGKHLMDEDLLRSLEMVRSRSGEFVAGRNEREIRVWRVGGEPAGAMAAAHHDGPVVGISDDGTRALLGVDPLTGKRTLADVGKGIFVSAPTETSTTALAPDGRLAYATADGVFLLSTVPDIPVERVAEGSGSTSLYFSSHSATLALGDEKGARLIDVNSHKVTASFPHPSPVKSVALSPDDTRLLTTTAADSTARVWNIATGQLERLLWVTDGGWCTLDPSTGRHTGAGSGLTALTYEDAAETGAAVPTLWLAEDLPELRDER
jgi:WD40 repeat protein/MinD-like ATPase involved in chromosome partitioning or flagellar assembly